MELSVVFQDNVLVRICYFLDVQDLRRFALCSKKFYRASRIGGADNVRWKIHSSQVLNQLMFNNLARTVCSYIRRVEISDMFSYNCLSSTGATIVDVIFEVHVGSKKNVIFSTEVSTYEYIECLRILIDDNCTTEELDIVQFPQNLKCFVVFESSGTINLKIPSVFPNSVKAILMSSLVKKEQLERCIFPDELEKFDWDSPHSFSILPFLPRKKLKILRLGQDMSREGLMGFNNRSEPGEFIFPVLEIFTLFNSANLKNAARPRYYIFTSQMPNIKNIQASRIEWINDIGLNPKKICSLANSGTGINF
jgi:hypothetical protein